MSRGAGVLADVPEARPYRRISNMSVTKRIIVSKTQSHAAPDAAASGSRLPARGGDFSSFKLFLMLGGCGTATWPPLALE